MPLHAHQTLLGIGVAFTLAACATTAQQSPSDDMLQLGAASAGGSSNLRDLTPEEKQVIMSAVSSSIKDPTAAKYRWARFSRDVPLSGNVNYCATVNAKSPYPAYSGWQSYIVAVNVSGGRITSAVIGAIAGGNDTPVIKKMCKRYGLDPANAG